MHADIRNNPLTGATAEQVTHYNKLLEDYVEYRASVFKELKGLCHDAPDFAMAQLFKGYLLLSMGTQSTTGAARQCAAEVVANASDFTEQERLHANALTAWSRGNTEKAVDIWEQILKISPLDLLALKLHHFALFWLGQPERMLTVCKQMRSHWNTTVPGYANYLGMLAFAEEELGNYITAEKLSREAIELNPDDLWSLHALAHTFEMQGRIEEGIALLDLPLDQFDDRNPFRGHLWWHLGMFAVEKGQYDRVLELYDKAIYADQSSFYLDLQNTASILARLEFCGVDVGDRWLPLGEVVKDRQGDHVLAFTEPHNTMILARCGDFNEIEQQLTSLVALASVTDQSISKIIKPLLIPLCEAVRDFYQASYQRTQESLSNLESSLIAVGGSHAQRDLFTLLKIQSVIDQGDFNAARKLLEPRLKLRPNSAINWQQYSHICREAGDEQQAFEAKTALERIANAA